MSLTKEQEVHRYYKGKLRVKNLCNMLLFIHLTNGAERKYAIVHNNFTLLIKVIFA